MTLLTAAIAAVIVTLVWYFKDGTNEMRIGTLSLMYWGATLMWLVDAVVEYIELKAAYFSPEPEIEPQPWQPLRDKVLQGCIKEREWFASGTFEMMFGFPLDMI